MIQAKEGYRIFKENYKWNKPIRSLGIRGSDLVNENYCEQLDFFTDADFRERLQTVDNAVDDINRLNMSTVAISNMERGVNGVSLDMMGVLPEALNSSVDYIAFGKKTLVLDVDLPEEKVVIMEFVKVMGR